MEIPYVDLPPLTQKAIAKVSEIGEFEEIYGFDWPHDIRIGWWTSEMIKLGLMTNEIRDELMPYILAGKE